MEDKLKGKKQTTVDQYVEFLVFDFDKDYSVLICRSVIVLFYGTDFMSYIIIDDAFYL